MEPLRREKICCICKKTDDDKYAYGEWQTVNNHEAHQFCLLFLTKSDNTADNDNIIDVEKLVNDFEASICYKCDGKYATVSCSQSECNRTFHVVCGETGHCLLEYVEPYKAYCHEHHPIAAEIPESWTCQICWEDNKNHDRIECIPSCCDQGWYHRVCIRKQAYFAGDNMKCPSCGDVDEDREVYQRFVRAQGVYIPARSALYEQKCNKKEEAQAKTSSQ